MIIDLCCGKGLLGAILFTALNIPDIIYDFKCRELHIFPFIGQGLVWDGYHDSNGCLHVRTPDDGP